MLKPKNSSQNGSVHVVIVVIIIIGIIGALGYVFWKNYVAKEDSSISKKTGSSKSESKKKSEIKELAGDMNKYVNYELGFEFLFPKAVSADTECATSDFVYDNYGNKVAAKMHYVTKAGAAPMTVLEDDGRFVVTTKNYVVLSDRTYDGEHAYASSCDVEPATVEKAEDINVLEGGEHISNMATRTFVVGEASDNDAITAFIQKNVYKEGTIASFGKLSNGRQDVNVLVNNAPKTGSFAYKLWYYPSKHKLVYIALGQSAVFTSVGELGKYYDRQVVDSFKFSTE